MEKRHQFNLWYLLIASMLLLVFQDWWQASRQVEVIPFSRFEALLRDDQVRQVWIKDDLLEGELKKPLADGKTRFVTTRVDADIAAMLTAHQVEFSRVIDSRLWSNILSWIAPAIFFVLIWQLLSSRMGGMQGGMMALGKSRAKIYVETNTKTRFADVAGVDEARAELQEVVNFLKDPKAYGRLGARAPKGVLLVGPPGTGKTLLARAVAGEAAVAFFAINGSEFVEMFVGLGAARVRDLFVEAAKAAPCIIFIDELDALAKARGASVYGGHDEKEQTLNQLLVELDGFDSSTGIVLLAATNRPEILDPALLRAGRFDRQVLVDRPDKPGRIAILNVHISKIICASDVSVERIASLTPGFTGADLANLINEAALLATRRGAQGVFAADFDEAIERIIAGLEKKSRILTPHERRVVAFHEMGHAIVAMALPGTDPVQKISIIPRGIAALGYTLQRPTEDRYLMNRDELQNKMAVLLGGRVAEELSFSQVSTGAGDDLEKATGIARSMVMRFGMSEKLGNVVFEAPRQQFLDYPGSSRTHEYSEHTARQIDAEIANLVDAAHSRATEILTRYQQTMVTYAEKLLQEESLSLDQLPDLNAVAAPPVAAR